MSTSFSEEYANLETSFKNRVQEDHKTYKELVYLPTITRDNLVDFVFIGMEPSLNTWATSERDATEKIQQGFRDFSLSICDFMLHYSIRQYLCSENQYYITNLSKGAMPVKYADIDRSIRYQNWYPLLLKELRIFCKPTSCIITIGSWVRYFLDKNK